MAQRIVARAPAATESLVRMRADGDPRERNRHERDREARKDERARRAGFEPLAARVVERLGRKARVRHEDGQRDECEERPDPYRFQKARPAPLLHFPTSLD